MCEFTANRPPAGEKSGSGRLVFSGMMKFQKSAANTGKLILQQFDKPVQAAFSRRRNLPQYSRKRRLGIG
jgi:hypothetical protein